MAEQTFTLTQAEYEALIALAHQGATTASRKTVLDDYLHKIETRNGVIRDSLTILWTVLDQAPDPSVRFPAQWPPQLKGRLTILGRKLTDQDVTQYVLQRSPQASDIFVTPDPAGVVGLSTLEDWFR